MPTLRKPLFSAEPILPEYDVAALGPAMQALTPLRRNWVLAKVFLALDDTKAARAAGYSESTADDRAYEIAQREDVQAAILEVGKALLRGEGARSIRTMVAIRDDKTVRADTRLKAAEMIANRAGFHVSTEHHEHVHTHLSDQQMDKRILALAAELGMAPDQAQKMLIAPADMEQNAEGVFELVVEQSPSEPSPNPVKRATRQRRAGMSPEAIEADKQAVRIERSERMSRERRAADAARVVTPDDPAEPLDEPPLPW